MTRTCTATSGRQWLSQGGIDMTAVRGIGRADDVGSGRGGSLGFVLFLLVNAALFLRPAELVEDLKTAPIYEVLIVACLAAALPRVLRQFTPRSLFSHPISLCMVGMLGAVVVSAFFNAGLWEACRAGFAFSKLLTYYLLLVAVVHTPARLRWFLYYLCGLILALTGLALLQYHGFIDLTELTVMQQRQWDTVDEETGREGVVLLRLVSAGFYNNPNDLSRIVVVGILVALYCAGDQASRLLRLLWFIPIGVFGYALALTHSRGGFLTLLAAVVAYLGVRYRGWKAVALVMVMVPLAFVLFSGRETNLSVSDGTGRQRLEIWRDSFAEWRHGAVVGIGMNQYAEVFGIAAHNSFVHGYTELGLIGGTYFTGAFYLALLLPYLVGRKGAELVDDRVGRFRPYLIGINAAYIVGMLSSSRNYIPPTYMLLGLTTVQVRLASAYLGPGVSKFGWRLALQVVLVSALSLLAIYLFVRFSLAGG
jgi:hypothetical protein